MPPNPPSQCPFVQCPHDSVPPTMHFVRIECLERGTKETVAKDDQDELTQLLKYEMHELYRNAFGSGFFHDDALIFPLSTPRESIPCSVVISECESVSRYEGLLSQITALKHEDVFSSCGERGGVGVIFVLSCFVVGGRVKKPQRALGGWL